MPKRNITRSKMPGTRFPLVTGLWLIGAMLGVVAGAVGSASLVFDKTVSTQRVFSGILRPSSTPIGVDLPRDAQLAALMVSEGEYVSAGQAIASLDLPGMEVRLAALKAAQIAQRYERACLLASEQPAFLEGLRDWIAQQAPSEALDAALLQASLQCQHLLDQGADLASVLETKLLGLQTRRELTAAKIQNVSSPQQVVSHSRTAQAIEALLDINRIDAEISQVERDLLRVVEDLRARRLTRLEELAREVNEGAVRVHRLEGLLSKERITAPVSGIVVRVRAPGPGHQSRQALRLVEIARAGQDRFTLQMQIAPEEARIIASGVEVDVSIVGIRALPNLKGTIQRAPPDGVAPELGAEGSGTPLWVSLDEESEEALSGSALGLAGAATQAKAVLTLPEMTVGERLRAAMDGLVLPEAFKSRSGLTEANSSDGVVDWWRLTERGL